MYIHKYNCLWYRYVNLTYILDTYRKFTAQFTHSSNNISTTRTRDIDPVVVTSWTGFCDVGLTYHQQRVNVVLLVGYIVTCKQHRNVILPNTQTLLTFNELSATIVVLNLFYLPTKSLIGNEMCVETSRSANVWSHSKQIWVIFTYLKMWVAV